MVRRKKLIVGNWKMNLNTHEASLYLHKLAGMVKVHRDVEVILAPTLLAVQSLSLQIDRRQFKLAAQNLYWRDEGAFTGEVSARQLHGVIDYVILGHSERRHIFGEADKDIRAKVQAAIRNNIKPILCIGETASEKTNDETTHVLHDQLIGGLANVTSEELDMITIAYEPVWALSNGKDFGHHATPTPEEIGLITKYIRKQIAHLYGKEASEKIQILYGGSVNSHNALAFLQTEGIDGLLVGGASLNAHEFSNIIKNAHSK
ncbi:MAG TPA: triose-phosphate isomerase [Candidatus Saccharimonadales bacterium]|nr:triose-phosphate isomerase [Candidatus Saccharimonadales bacterium]